MLTLHFEFHRDGLFFDSTKTYNACVMDRFDPERPKASIFLTSTLLYSTYVLVLLISLAAGLKQRINWLKACYVAAMNLAGYCFVIFLKEWSADTMCNMNKANGVSGHFAFYTFHLLTLPLIWRDSNWPEPQDSGVSEAVIRKRRSTATNLVRLLYFIFVVVMVTTLSRTYMHGYHSLRQCTNGTFIGVLMHLGCLAMLNSLDWPSAERIAESRRSRPSVTLSSPDLPLISFGIFTMVALWLSYMWHGALPLVSWELLILTFVWIRILWGP